MRIKTLKRNTSNVLHKAKHYLHSCKSSINLDLDALLRLKKELEEEIRVVKSNNHADHEITNGSAGDDDYEFRNEEYLDQLCKKDVTVSVYVKDTLVQLDALDSAYKVLNAQVDYILQRNVQRLLIELDTGGNIRLEEGKPNDIWYRSCIDLIQSRFFPSDFESLGINQIKISRVTRIHNRCLRARFEQQLESIVDMMDHDYKSSLEYLFFGRGLCKFQPEMHEIIENGFHPAYFYDNIPGTESGIPLTNSVSICEFERLLNDLRIVDRPSDQGTGAASSIQRSLIIAKVFLGNISHENTSRSMNNVKRSRNNNMRESQTSKETGISHPNGKLKICQQNYPTFDSVYRTKSGDKKQRLWFLFDHTLILPEYLIEYEFIRCEPLNDGDPTQLPIISSSVDSNTVSVVASFTSTDENDGDGGGGGSNDATWTSRKEVPRVNQVVNPQEFIISEIKPVSDSDSVDIRAYGPAFQEFVSFCKIFERSEASSLQLIDMPPTLGKTKHSTISVISEYVIKRSARTETLHTITHLNLHGNSIGKIENLDSLVHLKTLILSFNEIQRIEGLEHQHQLEVLELGYNRIDAVTGLDSLKKLKSLELNNNLLNRWDDIRTIQKSVLSLTELNLRNNPLCQFKNYRLLVIQHLFNLNMLDGHPILDEERESQTVQHDSIITDEMIIKNSFTNRRLGYSIGQSQSSYDRSMRLTSDKEIRCLSDWAPKIVELNLSGLNIQCIDNLGYLVNLKGLNLSNNSITHIIGLEKCLKLLELNLEKNSISKIEGLSTLLHLRRLDLGNNRISKLENLDMLFKLNQLSLEDNELISLQGVEHLSNLMELYVGNNRIASIKDVRSCLQDLPKLIILDLSGNVVAKDAHYRLFTVFHLRKLKVLDGLSISQEEQSLAKSEHSGKMTLEIIEQRVSHEDFNSVVELDLSNMELCEIDNLSGNFPNMTKLNLERNFLRSLRGIENLESLVILQLSFNKLDASSSTKTSNLGQYFDKLVNLEVLLLDNNHIASIAALQLHKLKRLKFLNLSNNDIQRVDGFDNLSYLEKLFLDKNKIRSIYDNAFAGCPNIRELRIEENMLRSLDGIRHLSKLDALYLGINRIADVTEIERLQSLSRLGRIVMNFNPITRRSIYRPLLVNQFPALKYIDNKEVTNEERVKIASIFRSEQQQFHQDNTELTGLDKSYDFGMLKNDTKENHESISVGNFETVQRSTAVQRQAVRIIPLSLGDEHHSTKQTLSLTVTPAFSINNGRLPRSREQTSSADSSTSSQKPFARKAAHPRRDYATSGTRIPQGISTFAKLDNVLEPINTNGMDFGPVISSTTLDKRHNRRRVKPSISVSSQQI